MLQTCPMNNSLSENTNLYLLGLSNEVQLSICCDIDKAVELSVWNLRVGSKVELPCQAHELNWVIIIIAVCSLMKKKEH